MSRSSSRRPSALPRFLGPELDDASGPLALLRLPIAECTPSRIEAALQRQLDRVDAHPESATPEADEVRLALHTAAAQLLDPAVRKLLIGNAAMPEARPAPMPEIALPELVSTPAPVVDESEGEPEETEQRPALAQPPIVAPEYVEQRLPVSTVDPDPNRNVRRLMLGAAIFAGLCVLVGGVGLIIMTTSGGSSTGSGTGSSAASTDGTTTPVVPTTSSATPTQTASDAPEPSVPEAAKAIDAVKPKVSEFTDPVLVVRQLRSATTTAKRDPVAGVKAFQEALPGLTDWWCRFDVAQRRAADDAVVEFLFATAGDAQVSAAAIDELARRAAAIGKGIVAPEAVWPAAWAAGALTRLSNERELPRALAASVNAALNDALGAGRSGGALTFEAGATAALRRMPERLVPAVRPVDPDTGLPPERSASAQAVKQWMDAVQMVNPDPMDAERVLADGLGQFLITGPEADANLGAYEAIELLATRIKWREGGPARDMLLEWFLDAAVTDADLRAVTGVLANKSGAEGVDATMVLSVGATPDDRSKLRSEYAAAWGIVQSEARDKALAHWRNQTQVAVGTPVMAEPYAHLIALVGASRYNYAARRLWLGDATGATRIVDDTPGILAALATAASTSSAPAISPGGPPLPASPTPRTPVRVPQGPASPQRGQPPAPFSPTGVDGNWAEAYLKAERNIPVRLDRLAALDQMPSPIGRVDGAVLAEAACFASPAQVRIAAQRAVERFANDPAMVDGMLQMLPIAPRVQSVAQTYERVAGVHLPKVGDPDWELLARRALVERLLGMLAAQGEQAGIELATIQIGEAYVRMAGVESGPTDESASDRALRGATGQFRIWRFEAERLPNPAGAMSGAASGPTIPSLDQIDRRRESRTRVANGPAQRFAAEQAAIAEVLAYVVAAERPTAGVKAAAILQKLGDDRRVANHVFVQMLANERAIARLWMLRFGGNAEGGA